MIDCSSGRRTVLRVYRSKKNADVDAEIQLLTDLDQRFPVPSIIPSQTGQYRVMFEDRASIMMEYIEGRHVPREDYDENLIHQLGKNLKSLHKSTQARNYRRVFDYVAICQAAQRLMGCAQFEGYLKLRHFVADELRFAADLHSDFSARGDCVLHADVDQDNLICDQLGKLWFLDWDDSTLGPPILDLAIAIRNIGLKAALDSKEAVMSSGTLATELLSAYESEILQRTLNLWVRYANFRYFILMLHNSFCDLSYPSYSHRNFRLCEIAKTSLVSV